MSHFNNVAGTADAAGGTSHEISKLAAQEYGGLFSSILAGNFQYYAENTPYLD